MTHTHGADAGRLADPAHGTSEGSEHHREIDWIAAERSPEFRELIRRKKGFVIPATVFFLSWYFGFIVLAGYAPDFMGETFITDGFTVGYALALTQFIMVWGLGWLYLRKADRVFDPLAHEAAEEALRAGARHTPGGRFEREPVATEEARATGTGSTTTAMASGQDGAPADREVTDR
jgi:uncharacterized membrane protein (DUF485 family)